MPILKTSKKNYLIQGVIDPITIIGVLFLVVTLALGAYTVRNKNISLNINEQAGCMSTCLNSGLDVDECENACGAIGQTSNQGGVCDCPFGCNQKGECKDDPNQEEEIVDNPQPITPPDTGSGAGVDYPCGYCSGTTCVSCPNGAVGLGQCTSSAQCSNSQGNPIQTTATTPPQNQNEPVSSTNGCYTNNAILANGSIVIGGIDGTDSSGFAVCINNRWENCPTCNISQLTVVPAYLIEQHCSSIGGVVRNGECITDQNVSNQTNQAAQIDNYVQQLYSTPAPRPIGQSYCSNSTTRSTWNGSIWVDEKCSGYCSNGACIRQTQTVEKTDEGFNRTLTTYYDYGQGNIDANTANIEAPVITYEKTDEGFDKTYSTIIRDSNSKEILNYLSGTITSSPFTSLRQTIPKYESRGYSSMAECFADPVNQGRGPAVCYGEVKNPNYASNQPVFSFARCQKEGATDDEIANCNKNMSEVYNSPILGRFIQSFSNPNNIFQWQQLGYSNSDEAIQDCINKNGINSGYACMKQMTGYGAEQVASSVQLGTTGTAIGALTIATGGAVTGALSLTNAIALGMATSTMYQTGNAVDICIIHPGSPECQNSAGWAAVSWVNVGTSGLANAYQASKAVQMINTVVNVANIGADFIDIHQSCGDGQFASDFGCVAAYGGLLFDVGQGGVDIARAVSNRPGSLISSTEADLALNRIFAQTNIQPDIPRGIDPNLVVEGQFRVDDPIAGLLPSGKTTSPIADIEIGSRPVDMLFAPDYSNPFAWITPAETGGGINPNTIATYIINSFTANSPGFQSTSIVTVPNMTIEEMIRTGSQNLPDITPTQALSPLPDNPILDAIGESLANVTRAFQEVTGINPSFGIIDTEPIRFGPQVFDTTNVNNLNIARTTTDIQWIGFRNETGQFQFPIQTRQINIDEIVPTTSLATRIGDWAGQILDPIANRLGLNIIFENLPFIDNSNLAKLPGGYPTVKIPSDKGLTILDSVSIPESNRHIRGYFMKDGTFALTFDPNIDHTVLWNEYNLNSNYAIASFDANLVQIDSKFNINEIVPEMARRMLEGGISGDIIFNISGKYTGLGLGRYEDTVENLAKGLNQTKFKPLSLYNTNKVTFTNKLGDKFEIGPGDRLKSDESGKYLIVYIADNRVDIKYETGRIEQIGLDQFRNKLDETEFSVYRMIEKPIYILPGGAYPIKRLLNDKAPFAGVIDINGHISISDETLSHNIIQDNKLLTDSETIGRITYDPDKNGDTIIISGSQDAVNRIVNQINDIQNDPSWYDTSIFQRFHKVKIYIFTEYGRIDIDTRLHQASNRIRTEVQIQKQNSVENPQIKTDTESEIKTDTNRQMNNIIPSTDTENLGNSFIVTDPDGKSSWARDISQSDITPEFNQRLNELEYSIRYYYPDDRKGIIEFTGYKNVAKGGPDATAEYIPVITGKSIGKGETRNAILITDHEKGISWIMYEYDRSAWDGAELQLKPIAEGIEIPIDNIEEGAYRYLPIENNLSLFPDELKKKYKIIESISPFVDIVNPFDWIGRIARSIEKAQWKHLGADMGELHNANVVFVVWDQKPKSDFTLPVIRLKPYIINDSKVFLPGISWAKVETIEVRISDGGAINSNYNPIIPILFGNPYRPSISSEIFDGVKNWWEGLKQSDNKIVKFLANINERGSVGIPLPQRVNITTITLGRDFQPSLFGNQDNVSRQHGTIAITQTGEIKYTDNSTNGTFYRNNPNEDYKFISKGQSITITPTTEIKLYDSQPIKLSFDGQKITIIDIENGNSVTLGNIKNTNQGSAKGFFEAYIRDENGWLPTFKPKYDIKSQTAQQVNDELNNFSRSKGSLSHIETLDAYINDYGYPKYRFTSNSEASKLYDFQKSILKIQSIDQFDQIFENAISKLRSKGINVIVYENLYDFINNVSDGEMNGILGSFKPEQFNNGKRTGTVSLASPELIKRILKFTNDDISLETAKIITLQKIGHEGGHALDWIGGLKNDDSWLTEIRQINFNYNFYKHIGNESEASHYKSILDEFSLRFGKNKNSGQTLLEFSAIMPAVLAVPTVGLYYLDQYFDWGILDRIKEELSDNPTAKSLGAALDSGNFPILEPLAPILPLPNTNFENINYIPTIDQPTNTTDVTKLEINTEDLTSYGEGECTRNGNEYCDGTRMYELYLWYKNQPDGWWQDGDFTPADFLAMMLVAESTGGDPELLKAIMTATANQLWGSSDKHKPYCTTPDCAAGIFNFLGDYVQSAGERYNGLISNNGSPSQDTLRNLASG